MKVVHSAILHGVDGVPCEVSAEKSSGLPLLSFVGIPDVTAHEMRYRVQCALASSGIELPRRLWIVSVSPSTTDSSAMDLPAAVAMLREEGVLPHPLMNALFFGELSLTGNIRPVRGAYNRVKAPAPAGCGHAPGRVYCAPENAMEAKYAAGPNRRVYAPRSLRELISALKGDLELAEVPMPDLPAPSDPADFSEYRSQAAPALARAMAICAVARLNPLLIGPPGSGKTMIARRVPTILPALTESEARESVRVWSAAGLLINSFGLLHPQPFRAPHHTISEAALVGGGTQIRPGELSLAHNGVLFLDEAPELPRRCLEALRGPLSVGSVTLSRASRSYTLPTQPMMVIGAMNPCPCGWQGDRSGRCTCSEEEVLRYRKRIPSGLFDLAIEVPQVSYEVLSDSWVPTVSSAEIRAWVERGQAKLPAVPSKKLDLLARLIAAITAMSLAPTTYEAAEAEALALISASSRLLPQ